MSGFLKRLRQKKWFAIASNVYVLVITGFLVWMLFLDTNSWMTHRELNKEIKKLEEQRSQLEEEITKDKALIEKLKDPEQLEKYARERYNMKKEGEEVFIIEYEDSLKTNQDE